MPAYDYLFDGQPIPDLTKDQRWSIHFQPVSRPVLDLRTECVMTAKSLAQQASDANQPVCVHLSGGDDSVVMALSLMEVGCPFTTTTRIYKSHGCVMNNDDVLASTRFVEKWNLPHSFHVIENMDEIWRTGPHHNLRDLSVLSVRLGHLEHPNMFNIMATAPFIASSDHKWKLVTSFSIEGTMMHSFFLDNPELMMAMLNDSAFDAVAPAMDVLNILVEQATRANGRPVADLYLYEKVVKAMILHRAWPELSEYPRVKNTGFEVRPPEFDNTPSPQNQLYIDTMWRKAMQIPLQQVKDLVMSGQPVSVHKENDQNIITFDAK